MTPLRYGTDPEVAVAPPPRGPGLLEACVVMGIVLATMAGDRLAVRAMERAGFAPAASASTGAR